MISKDFYEAIPAQLSLKWGSWLDTALVFLPQVLYQFGSKRDEVVTLGPLTRDPCYITDVERTLIQAVIVL